MYPAINHELEENVNDKAEKIFTEVMDISGCTEEEMFRIFTAEELGLKPRYTKEDLARFAKSDSEECRTRAENYYLKEERLNYLKKTLSVCLLMNLKDAILCHEFPNSISAEVLDAAALRLLEA